MEVYADRGPVGGRESLDENFVLGWVRPGGPIDSKVASREIHAVSRGKSFSVRATPAQPQAGVLASGFAYYLG